MFRSQEKLGGPRKANQIPALTGEEGALSVMQEPSSLLQNSLHP